MGIGHGGARLSEQSDDTESPGTILHTQEASYVGGPRRHPADEPAPVLAAPAPTDPGPAPAVAGPLARVRGREGARPGGVPTQGRGQT